MNRRLKQLLVASLLLPTAMAAAPVENSDNNLEEISRNIDLFNIIYKELDLLYVDSINPENTIRSGIDAMLENLDPYTTYISEDESEDFKIMLTGEYAGVGASIGIIKDTICFTEIYEGTPSAKNGIKAGDQIIEVAGKSTSKMSVSDVSEHLRGESNTQVKLLIKDPITHKTKKVTITREKITLPTIEFADTIQPGIGYIRFSRFIEKSASQFKNAFLELKEKGIESLIIDLRNNPGGLLDQATQIVNYFIENQSTIVYTKSKVKQLDEVYKATKNPLDNQIPIVVLVNRNSASASEIFSGALQDLDRAVIVGERTYGKGLVQMTKSLPFGGSLKITTSKYYIPSGRCVQAINYSERDENGYVQRIPDSLTTEFKTANGRIVRDGGGVTPDVTIEKKTLSTISYNLYTDRIIFDYAVRYLHKHPKIASPKDFKFTDYDDFVKYCKTRDFSYKLKSEELLAELKELAQSEGYLEHTNEEFAALEKKLSHNLEQDLQFFKEEITQLISIEIAQQQYLQKGVIIESLKYDNAKQEAIQILKDPQRYKSILQPKKDEKE